MGFLLDHAEAQVDRLFCFDDFRRFELNMLAAQVFNQPRPAAEQHRHEVDKDFVDEPECDELLCNVPALYHDILIACRFFRCFKRGFNAINKRVHATSGMS